jgi:hypothetical protein
MFESAGVILESAELVSHGWMPGIPGFTPYGQIGELHRPNQLTQPRQPFAFKIGGHVAGPQCKSTDDDGQ